MRRFNILFKSSNKSAFIENFILNWSISAIFELILAFEYFALSNIIAYYSLFSNVSYIVFDHILI